VFGTARRALGRTAPNLVGSVIIQDGQIVGEGFHPGAGQPHAEIFALRAAGDRALGATVYVNLEPCNHYGRTPPCSEAWWQLGLRKWWWAWLTLTRVSGAAGYKRGSAGGVEENDCRQMNEAFIHRILYHQPLVF